MRLILLFGRERAWTGHGTDTQRDVNFEILHLLVWNGGSLEPNLRT